MDILTQPSDHTRLAQAEVESIKESLTKNIAADELPGLIERLTQATTKLQSLSQKDSTYIKLENEFTGSIEQAATLFKTIDKTLLAVHSLADNVTHQGTDFAPLLAGIANQLQDSFPKLMTTASGQLRALGEHLNARYSAAPEYIQAQEQILIDLYQAYEAVIDYLRAADISSNPSKVDSPREESQEVITAVLSEQAVYDISTPQAEWGYQVITENVAATNWEDFVDQYVAEAQVVEAAAEPVRETERASLPIIDLDSEPQAATVSASVETTSEAIIAEPRKLSLPIVDLDAEPQVSSEPTFVEIITEPNEIEPAVETGINNTQDSEHVLDEEPKQALSDAEAAAETKRIDGSKTVIESREEATARVRKTTIEQATIPAPSKEQHPLVNEFGRELAELGLEYREAHQAQTSVAEAIANLSWKMFSDSIAAGKTLMQKIRSFGNTK
ncbi:MAG: hypothetical protein KDD62_14965, partial [Bdellovibrionales bacterium]|nr:hypothetical protein [Bdellovibrionales bacterium]